MTNGEHIDAERNMLAAEYGLGLLEGAELLEAQRLYRDDPAFAQEADRWMEEAASWSEEGADSELSREVYSRIASAVGVHPEIEAIRPVTPAPVNSPGYWRPWALAASLAAVAFAGLWLNERSAPVESIAAGEEPARQTYEPSELSIAQISSDDTPALVNALYDNDTGTLYVKLSDIPDPERVPQLWLLDSTGTPRSLGFGTRSANSQIVLSDEQRQIAREGGTLAISLEQPAEVPHASPSDVIGAAQLARLDQQP